MRRRIARLAHDPLRITAQKISLATLRVATGFIFVAEADEISNLDLITDVDKIVKLLEVFSLEHQRE